MKALILTCSTGQGHNSAAKAIKEAMDRCGAESELCDALSFGAKQTSKIVSSSYVNVAVKAPNAFGFMYKAGDFISNDKIKSPVYLANMFYADNLKKYIESGGFNAVVCSHLFPMEALTHLKRRHSLKVKCYGIYTDYTCIPFIEETDMDKYFIPHADLAVESTLRGMIAERLVATGIPVSGRFNVNTPKMKARENLGLDAGADTFLVMTGGIGFGDVLDVISELLRRGNEKTSIIVLIGKNATLRTKINDKYCGDSRVKVVAFTERVAEYMDACDVLLTKPGGLSSTEFAVKNVATVHTMPIPGCETKNALFFAERGMSFKADTASHAAELAELLLENVSLRETMMRKQRREIHNDAADKICEIISRDVDK